MTLHFPKKPLLRPTAYSMGICLAKHLGRNISTTVQDRGTVSMEHLYQTMYCQSNGHMTYGVMEPKS